MSDASEPILVAPFVRAPEPIQPKPQPVAMAPQQETVTQPECEREEKSFATASVESSAPVETTATEPAAEAAVKNYRIVGEVFHSYVIVEVGDKMLLVDKHAAHERIIFEKLKAGMKHAEVESQLLMLPIDVMLMSDEVSVIEEYRAELEAVGFHLIVSIY